MKFLVFASLLATGALASQCHPNYECCNSCNVVYVDNEGYWGAENNNWCVIRNECGLSNNAVSQYPTCSHCNVYYRDASGDWGVENNNWCVIQSSRCGGQGQNQGPQANHGQQGGVYTISNKVIPVLTLRSKSGNSDFATKPVEKHISQQSGNRNAPEPYYEECDITLENTNGAKVLDGVKGKAKVRGNWTSNYPKKGLRLSFEQAQSIPGLNNGNKFKNWVLLAEYKDGSMLRNKCAFDISRGILNPDGYYSSDGQLIELVINNEYFGVYLLGEYQQINEGRVNITKAKENYTGVDIGYLLELDNGYASYEDNLQKFTVNYNDNAPLKPFDGNGGSTTITPNGGGGFGGFGGGMGGGMGGWNMGGFGGAAQQPQQPQPQQQRPGQQPQPQQNNNNNNWNQQQPQQNNNNNWDQQQQQNNNNNWNQQQQQNNNNNWNQQQQQNNNNNWNQQQQNNNNNNWNQQQQNNNNDWNQQQNNWNQQQNNFAVNNGQNWNMGGQNQQQQNNWTQPNQNNQNMAQNWNMGGQQPGQQQNNWGNFGIGRNLKKRQFMMGSGENFVIKSDVYSQQQHDFIASYVNNAYKVMYEAAYNKKAYKFTNDYSSIVEASDLSPKQAIQNVVEADSLADLYIISEIACDADLYYSSFYLDVDFGPNGSKKLRFEAPWDFDSALGNRNRCDNGRGLFAANATPDNSSFSTGNNKINPWLAVIIYEDWFQDIIKNKWSKAYNGGVFSKVINNISTQTQVAAPAFERNYSKWDNINNNKSFVNELSSGAKQCKTQSQHANFLAQWLQARIQFINGYWGK